MAVFPKGPDTFFSLSPASAKPECYALKRGQIEGRISAEYYRLEFRELFEQLNERFPRIKSLRAYTEIVCGPFGTEVKLGDYISCGVPLLRISNITHDGTLNLEDVVFITPEKSAKLSSTRVSAGDLVISQRGTLGMPAVVTNEYPTFNISANLIGIRKITELQPRYIQLYLTSRLGERQIARLQSGQVHAKITTDDVASVLIPNAPNQAELITAMDAARAERQAKLADADALLASLDAFLIEVLDLVLPPTNPRRVFAVRHSLPRGQGRLNPDYYHPERTLVLKTLEAAAEKLSVEPLSKLVTFERDQIKTPGDNYLGLAHVQSHTGELTDSTEEATGVCFTYAVNDVLFARLRPYLNKVYRAEMNGCCSPEFHVLRAVDRKKLLPDYLAVVLRSKIVLVQTIHMMTGNTHPRLANEDVTNLLIPIPKPEIQENIAAEARRRRLEARRLRAEAEAGWQAAKRWFEEQLLRPAA